MTALRRHLFATTWAILSAQTLVLALGTAQLCSPGEHTHGGAAAPDCPMHHQAQANPEATQHQSHTDHTATSEGGGGSHPRMSCRCSNDLMSIYLGQAAIVPAPATWSPFVQAVMLAVPSNPSIADLWFSPPSPPPR